MNEETVLKSFNLPTEQVDYLVAINKNCNEALRTVIARDMHRNVISFEKTINLLGFSGLFLSLAFILQIVASPISFLVSISMAVLGVIYWGYAVYLIVMRYKKR